jgi:hypothetical protein
MGHFMDWHKEWNAQLKSTGDTVGFYRNIMVPAHPEHYALHPYLLGIIEIVGGHIARSRLQSEMAPDFVQKYGIPGWENVQMWGTLDYGSTFC